MTWLRISDTASILALLPAVPVVIPDADPIALPAPIWLLRFLLLLTLVLHLLPMNLVLGGSLLTLLSYGRARGAAAEIAMHHRRLIAVLAWAFPAAVAFTITLGVAPLLFVQVLYGQLFFSSSILMAWLWLAVVALLLVGYYAAYWHAFRHETAGAAGLWIVAVPVFVFLAIAFLFVNNVSLLQNPEMWRPLFLQGRRGLHLYALWDGGVFVRSLHFVLAALAVSGLVVAAVGLRHEEAEPAFGRWAKAYGGRWFVGATILQFGSGIWFLSVQPPRVRDALVGGSLEDSSLLLAGIGFALVAVVLLAFPSRISSLRFSLGSGAIGLTVVLMVLLRQRVRTLWLLPHFRYEALPIASQWGAILLFFFLLLIGISLVAWMLWRFFRQPARGSV
ncbi:MAG TPA: hypothetical protein VLM91_22985 [Candidatus Methylomirabilis sp.]|nr:hypothetical protein [Candidatus Methylomirabilis sp.]